MNRKSNDSICGPSNHAKNLKYFWILKSSVITDTYLSALCFILS